MGARGNVPAPHLAHLRPRPDAHASRGARRVHPRVCGDGGGDPRGTSRRIRGDVRNRGRGRGRGRGRALGDETDTARADVPRVSGARRKPRPARHREPREVRHETGAVGGGRGRTRAEKRERRRRRKNVERTARRRRSRVLFFAPPRAHRSPRARQRVLRTEQQPPRHLVRRGYGRRRRGAERVESSAVGTRRGARVRSFDCRREGASGTLARLLRAPSPRHPSRAVGRGGGANVRPPPRRARASHPRERRAMGLPRGGDVPRSRDDVRPVVGRGARRRGRLHSGRAGGGARTNGRTRGVVS